MKLIRRLVITVFLAALVYGVLALAYAWANGIYLRRAQEAGQSTLVLVTEAMNLATGRFAPIPNLIADDPALRDMLNLNVGSGYAPYTNEKLRQVAFSIGAEDVYVMDTTGLTVAASNYRDEDSFVGRNFAYRPYFTASIEGQTSVYHALGITSGERGIFFSAPILDGIEVIGVMVVKMTVDEIESEWVDLGHEILIADANGIVFISSRPDYRFRTLAPLREEILQTISQTQQFPIESLSPIGLSAGVVGASAVQVTIGQDPNTEQFISESASLDVAGWHAIVFTPLQPIQGQVYRTLALTGFALIAMILAVMLFAQRRANVMQRIRFEQEQRAKLEHMVQERTKELDSANVSLRAEVAERRLAEKKLRKSQKELVQAGKLAALGQMSAAISHEINQPLAAIKTYADNASEFLKRSRPDDARDNIVSISKMSDRMAQISRHLRNFARQPGDTLQQINVNDTIVETIDLVGPQLRANHARIEYDPNLPDAWALGGRLRLQQVLVNIINNALEAMSGQRDPTIEISLSMTTDKITIELRDHGPGLPPETMDQVFDAFFTTKDAGVGMGLGMSISHNIISDFGGSLTARNHPDGGAVFTVTLVANHGTDAKEAAQ